MNKYPESDNLYNISYENAMDTDACTECTGLIYTAAENGEEWETYQEIYDFAVPRYDSIVSQCDSSVSQCDSTASQNNFATPQYPQSASQASKQPHKSQDK